MQLSLVCITLLLGFLNAEICTDNVCHFHLVVRRVQTMTYFKPDGSASYNVIEENGRFKVISNSLRPEGSDDLIGTYLETDDVISGDGSVRNVIVVNDQFPGPTIEVMEGAQVVIKIENKLQTDGVVIHWHGLYQRDTPWMDGVAYITQCPLQPRQSFEYRFTAFPSGTHWYHSHFWNQKLDGLYGMFIVHKRMPDKPYMPLMVADFFKVDAETMEILNPWATEYRGTGEMHLDPLDRDFSVDAVQLGAMHYDWYVGMINGRARRTSNTLPLYRYTVNAGDTVRFHMVHVGAEYPYEVSVDGHMLRVMASDGYEINPVMVTSIYIQPGESYDFEVDLDQTPGLYWVRAETIKWGVGWDATPDGIERVARAVLAYDGTDDGSDPVTTERVCDADNACTVFNCHFAGFADSHNKQCITFDDATSALPKSDLDKYYGVSDEDFEEYFFTFSFSVGSGVNGKKFVNPKAPMFQGEHPFDYKSYITKCEDQDCEEGCRCTQFVDLPYNKTIQMVMANMEDVEIQKFFAHHPIHMHGHGFAVLKMGFPDYDPVTGHWTSPNNDVLCEDRYCNPARWNGQRPTDLNHDNPPVKDTLTIPARGYAVVRFRTDNPGFWFLHCHSAQHVADGMQIIMNEAEEHHPIPPRGFPTCADFSMTEDDYNKYKDHTYGREDHTTDITSTTSDPQDIDTDEEVPSEEDEGEYIRVPYGLAAGVLVGFTFLGAGLSLIPLFIYICCMARNKPSSPVNGGKVNGAFDKY